MRINFLQRHANLDEIVEKNAPAFEGLNVKDSFGTLSSKLGELGFDVLINDKKNSEFVPTTRLNEVIEQRNSFKGQVEKLNADLLATQKAAGENNELKTQIQTMMDNNTKLLADLDNMRIQSAVLLAAKDAIDPSDIVMYLNKDNIKINAKGEILGVEDEVERIKKAKPHLFTSAGGSSGGKAGGDPGGDKGAGGKLDMNALIRQRARR